MFETIATIIVAILALAVVVSLAAGFAFAIVEAIRFVQDDRPEPPKPNKLNLTTGIDLAKDDTADETRVVNLKIARFK